MPIASVRPQAALFVRGCEKSRWEAAAQAKLRGSDFSPQTPALFVIQRVKSDLLFIVIASSKHIVNGYYIILIDMQS